MVLVFVLLLALLAEAIGREIDRLGLLGKNAGSEPCPCCGSVTEVDWLICPRCRSLLQKHCANCGRSKAVENRFCPWCGISDRRGEP